MSKQFWTFLLVGLAAVGMAVAVVWFSTKGAHLELKGEIFKIRDVVLDARSVVVVADFRIRNPSDVAFVVKSVEMWLEPNAGEPVLGRAISKRDLDDVFNAEKLLGPKFNEGLSIRDKIGARQAMDRMVATRFELPASSVEERKGIRLRIEDLDGTVAELTEKK